MTIRTSRHRSSLGRCLHAVVALLLVGGLGCGEAAEPEATAPQVSGGKGDSVLTPAQCEAEFAAFVPCPEIDVDQASQEELAANIACLEELAQSPVWACCEQESLRSSSFCTERAAEGRASICEMAHDDYQSCALDDLTDTGACRQGFLAWDNAGWSCCDILDTGLCDGPREAPAISGIDELTQRIFEADGYVHLSPLFEQMYPVDIIPELLQDSLPLYSNPFASPYKTLEQHEVAERLPVQYAVRGFGERIREQGFQADAYLTFWRTVEGRTVVASHFYDKEQIVFTPGGWAHGPTFVLEEHACELLNAPALQNPTFGELAFVLDEANGQAEGHCLSHLFTPVDLTSGAMSHLERYLASRYFDVVGDDSRIDTIEGAYRIESAGFRGLLLEMVEVPSAETLEIYEEIGETFVPRRERVLLNEHDEVVSSWDDESCEASPLSSTAPVCAGPPL